MQTLGAFAASLMAVGYVAGRYRESVGRPTRRAVPLLGAGFTLLGLLAFTAIQVGTGIDADVSTLIVSATRSSRPCWAQLLALPVFLLVRLVLRPALVEDRPGGRRPATPSAAETQELERDVPPSIRRRAAAAQELAGSRRG